ncbi:MAG: glycosyltransferase [Clostridiales bacterium]|nr:glycosyltransferase [Clostridiales bacterium]
MLDIVVPVYNEDKGILRLFEEIEQEIKTPKRVMIVYDFDEDTTVPVVLECRNNYSFSIDLVLNTLGRGALNAIRTGMQTATAEMVLVMMADSSDRLDVVDTMCSMMDQGYDLVCGSRYMKGGKQNGGPFLKSLFSRTAGISLHLLTRIPTHDCSNSFKLYRRTMLEHISIESTGGFEIGLEILVKAYTEGYRIGEVPSEWFDREDGESNFHMWKWLPSYLHWYWYCIKHTWFNRRGQSA